MSTTTLLVIGAGPYGLAVAAYARRRGVECRIVGEPMEFWRHHMPAGMLLRSGTDWHLDAAGTHTFKAFLTGQSIDQRTVLPIRLGLFLEYAAWFQERAGIEVERTYVTALRTADGGYEAELTNGRRIRATNVVVATGIGHFAQVPPEVVLGLSPARYAHTRDLVDFVPLQGRRCLIVGGRQSAFEWAALIREQAGAKVEVVYRHATPRFERSNWSWVDPLIDEAARVPGWYRRLAAAEREAIARRFWEEGRLKLEPWLWPRLDRDGVTLRPGRCVRGYRELRGGEIEVTLDDGSRLGVDHVALATGYRVDLARLPFLSQGAILAHLRIRDGYPELDEYFQANLPGLFFTGLAASQDFGPFFGFVRGCGASARLIVERIAPT